MLETLVYLTAAVAATVVLVAVTPPDTPLLNLICGVGLLTLLLAVAQHGPTAIVTVIDAITRLRGR